MKTKKEPTGDDRGSKIRQDSKANINKLADALPEFKSDPRFPILPGFAIGRSIVVHSLFCDKLNAHGWDPKLTERDVYYPEANCDFKNHPFSEGLGVLYGVSPFPKADLKSLEKRREQAEQYGAGSKAVVKMRSRQRAKIEALTQDAGDRSSE
jgi:hypothetical protein